ncbi:MAG TPA: TonB-dependent receptor [Bacteroidales bacterium]|nr:TonB-dependent receptor [Bacteroidales bacterium]
MAQNKTITGVVTDNTGEILPGVTIQGKGTPKATATDANGKYSIAVAPNATLVFTFIGMEPEEVQVNNQTVVNVTLKKKEVGFEDVVVIGYGTQKKRDLTGSISSVTSKSIEERQPVDIFQALQGEAAGLQVFNNSGAPGSTGTMLIRGASTMGSGVNPLYIVDGITVEDISGINPMDIQSIEVLKDAASAAIYGSRSAAGVIIVTTKKGKEGAPPRITLRYNHSFEKLGHKLNQANAFERYLFERKSNVGTSLWKTSNDSLHPNTMADNDYQNMISRVAQTNQYDFNLAGAKNNMSYYTSLGYLDQQGIIINSYYRRLTSRTNVDYQATKALKLMTKLNLTYSTTNNINTGSVLQQALKRPPQMALYFPDGSYVYNNGGQFNPIADAYQRVNITDKYNVNFYQGAELKLIKGLTWMTDVQAIFGIDRNNSLTPAALVSSTTSSGSNSVNLDRKLTAETYINWDHSFGDHSFNAMAGASVEDWYGEAFDLIGTDYVSESILSTNAQQVKDVADTYSYFTSHSMASFFGRFSYNYLGKYLFTSNLRYDGSSRFINNRWGLFPSASAAWRFSDEDFFNWSQPVLSDGKLRLSWGSTGNERVGNYDAITSYQIGSYYNSLIGVYQSSRIANANLKWEATKQTDLGLDLSFLNGRITVVADYYNKLTTDLLSLDLMPSELGVSDMRINFGSIQNRGLELSVSAYPVQNNNFTWQTTLTYSKNNNKVISLNGGESYIEDNKYWIQEGAPLGQWYGYKNTGVYAYDESNAYAVDADGKFGERLTPVFQTDPNNYGNIVYGSNGKPIFDHYVSSNGETYSGTVGKMTSGANVLAGGDVIWEDVNHDGAVGDADRQILGNGLPSWNGGWTNYFTYKNFSLSFSCYGSFGNMIYNQQRRSLNTYSSSNVTPFADDVYAVWKYQGQYTPGFAGKNATTGTNNARELSSQFLENGDYIRLTNLRFSYQLDKNLSKKIGANNLSVYVYGNDLMTWTNYSGFDPSNISNSNVLRPGQDNGRYPSNKEVGLGININL